MRQFLIPCGCKPGTVFRVNGGDYHYLSRVRRLRVGQEFTGTNGAGTRFQVVVLQDEGHSLVLQARTLEPAGTQPPAGDRSTGGPPAGDRSTGGPPAGENSTGTPAITLYQCTLKGRKMDQVVRQATEAGVRRIVPVDSSHTVARMGQRAAGERRKRWHRIVKEALQQSGTGILPCIGEPRGIQSLAEEVADDVRLLFHHMSCDGPSLHELLAQGPQRVSILVGPEGGFTEREVELLIGAGFSPIRLGTTVLRSETAALCAISAVRVILQERDSWNTQDQRR